MTSSSSIIPYNSNDDDASPSTAPNLQDLLRLHPQNPKPIKPKLPRTKPDPLTLSRPATISPCTECGKRFNSWKALFGHMRCHPERQWRGINPPPQHSPRFQVSNPDLPLMTVTDEEYEVASSLMLLASGPTSAAITRKNKRARCCIENEAYEECSSWRHSYVCDVCMKEFGSGQALGGHMRCHANGDLLLHRDEDTPSIDLELKLGR